MKETRILMGMPITVHVVDKNVEDKDIQDIYDYFTYIDEKFSTYKETSEISKINFGKLKPADYSVDMRLILKLCEETKGQTNGYFDIKYKGKLDPSGLVKGWSIYNAAKILEDKGFKNYYIDAGGDIQIAGKNSEGEPWTIGIRNPFNRDENVKILQLTDSGVATSGIYIRGQHVYNPFKETDLNEVLSITVIGPNIYEADRFATAAFAMQREGIHFIETLKNFEGYMIDKEGSATMTTNFEKYILK
jgi:thiamine biosynthesis lipoprotein